MNSNINELLSKAVMLNDTGMTAGEVMSKLYQLTKRYCEKTNTKLYQNNEELIGVLKEILKTTEPKVPVEVESNFFGSAFGKCAVCGEEVLDDEDYCALCGTAINWADINLNDIDYEPNTEDFADRLFSLEMRAQMCKVSIEKLEEDIEMYSGDPEYELDLREATMLLLLCQFVANATPEKVVDIRNFPGFSIGKCSFCAKEIPSETTYCSYCSKTVDWAN